MVATIIIAEGSAGQAWLEVLGHLHPLIVHFPIALSTVAALAVLWNWLRRHDGLGEFALNCIWIAALASVIVSASGWFFAEEDARETPELFLHRWFGIGSSAGLVILALMTSFVRSDSRPVLLAMARLGAIAAAVAIGVTAHFGGEMVWGEGQVSKPLSEAISLSWHGMRENSADASASAMNAPNSEAESPAPLPSQENEMMAGGMLDDEEVDPPSAPAAAPSTSPSAPPASPAAPSDAQPAAAPPAIPKDIPKNLEYNKDIRPIFEARCWECHGKGQAKGGVAFDHVGELIVKDKKKGIIVAGKPDVSTLVKLIKKPPTAKGRMPPKGERLTSEQIALIEAWIQQGAKVAAE